MPVGGGEVEDDDEEGGRVVHWAGRRVQARVRRISLGSDSRVVTLMLLNHYNFVVLEVYTIQRM